MSNVLPMAIRVRIVAALSEGNSIRAASRLTSADKNAVANLALLVGEGCARLHNRLVRGVSAHLIEADEQWSFIGKKEARVEPGKDPADWGDVYTFYAVDAVNKLIISYHVGRRDQASTDAFVADLRARLRVVPQVSTDGFSPYLQAMAEHFRGHADFGQVVKNYRTGSMRGPDHRYEPPRDPFISKTPVMGVPDVAKMSTSHVERLNLTMRHTVGRKRRLCLAFSKTLRGHRAAEALGVAVYNWVRVHGTLGQTPAMAAGLAERPWTLEDLVRAALEERETEAPVPQPLEPPPGRSGRAAPRELPNGRGWLRVVGDGKGVGAEPRTEAAPPAAQAVPLAVPAVRLEAPAAPPVVTSPEPAMSPVDDRQLSLLNWRPKPREPVQLLLFGALEPAH